METSIPGLAVPPKVHEDLILDAAGGVCGKLDLFLRHKGIDGLDEADRPDGNRSSTPTPVLSNFFAMYTTSLKLCSIRRDLASSLPVFPSRSMAEASSSGRRGGGRTSASPDIVDLIFLLKKHGLKSGNHAKLKFTRHCYFYHHSLFPPNHRSARWAGSSDIYLWRSAFLYTLPRWDGRSSFLPHPC